MTSRDIVHHRLVNQGVINSKFTKVEDIVRWMGCMQAQDFAGAKWAIGSRIKGITDTEIEHAFNEDKIIRTHILRPTWHFVAPQDIRWMLNLTAPKIKALSKGFHRKLDITDATLKKSKDIISKALSDGHHVTRTELKKVLQAGRVNTDDIRLGFYIMDAELDGVICSGKKQGKQFTYKMLDQHIPDSTLFDFDVAIAELGKRYFMSHGPATLQDFAWWSGLNLSEAKKSLESNKRDLQHVVVNGQAYWFSAALDIREKPISSVHLLPAYDELTVAYKDRSDIIESQFMDAAGNGIFKPIIISEGQVVGTWKSIQKKDKMVLEITPLKSLTTKTAKAIEIAGNRYAEYVEKHIVFTIKSNI